MRQMARRAAGWYLAARRAIGHPPHQKAGKQMTESVQPNPREDGHVFMWSVVDPGKNCAVGAMAVKADSYREAIEKMTEIVDRELKEYPSNHLAVRGMGPFPAWFIAPKYRDRLLSPRESSAIPEPI